MFLEGDFMVNIENSQYYSLDVDDNNVIQKNNIYIYGKGSRLVFPLSFDDNVLQKNMQTINLMKSQKYIHDKSGYGHEKDCGLAFDLTCNIQRHLSYEQWNKIIDFALENNINFRVNLREEYTAEEMKNYIEAFSVEKMESNNLRLLEKILNYLIMCCLIV